MRISTLHFFQQGIQALQEQQAKIQQTELQLASGLRFNKPSEDPAAAVKVLDLNSKIEVIDQYARNTTTAQAALGFEENVITSVQNSLQRIRELVIQGNNATNAGSPRESIAQEIYQRLDELVALGNTRDAQGDYIFGGFKVDAPPFVESAAGVIYQGDQGRQSLKIGDGARIAIRDSGYDVFQKIASGDGSIQVIADAGNTGTAVAGLFGLTGTFTPDAYTVTFNQAGPTAPITYTVTDSASNVITTGPYEDGNAIGFAGAQVSVSGTPADGDTIELSPSVNKDIFSTIRSIADAMAGTTTGATNGARFNNAMNQGLANLDQGMENINSIRAGIGARLNNVDTFDELNQDFKLQLQTTLSDTQDLDFTEAISRFNLQLTSLQAAQQAYIRTTGLSLFQYL